MPADDSFIIYQCLQGDTEAFGLLVDKYRASIYGLAYAKVRDFHDAQDITQEAFIRAYAKLRTLKQHHCFVPWLYTITINLCKQFGQARSRRPETLSLAELEPPAFDTHSLEVHQNSQEHELLRDALACLPRQYAEVLSLFYLGGLSTKEIGEVVGARPNTIAQRLRRARLQMKQEMLELMETTCETAQLQPAFTFQVMESLKHTRMQPSPQTPWWPWGVSGAAGTALTLVHFSIWLALMPLYGSGLGADSSMLGDAVQILFLDGYGRPFSDGAHAKGEGTDNGHTTGTSTTDGRWRAIRRFESRNAPTARRGHAAAWTGREMLVWGGFNDKSGTAGVLADGGRYDPASNTWTLMSSDGSPSPRGYDAVVWTGNRLFVWGGFRNENAPGSYINDGGLYNPVTDTWEPLLPGNEPEPRREMISVWTGNEVIVGGGEAGTAGASSRVTYSDYHAYNPRTGWRPLAEFPLAIRHTINNWCWTGRYLVVWGGKKIYSRTLYADGAMYDPSTDKWLIMSPSPLQGRDFHTIASHGDQVFIWGGTSLSSDIRVYLADGAIYNTLSHTWTPTNMTGALSARSAKGFSIGSKVMILGGIDQDGLLADGATYDMITNRWEPIPALDVLSSRSSPSMVWTGESLVVWGGRDAGDGIQDDGYIYEPWYSESWERR